MRSYLLLCLMMLLLLVPTSFAQDTQPAIYDGLDVLFIIDQSGSMGGVAFGSPQNDEGSDPQGMRFVAPQTALNLLNTYIGFDVNNVPTVNLSLMAFGQSNRLLLNWTEFDPKKQGWDTEIKQILDDVSASRFLDVAGNGTNLGYTDFVTAMEMAQSQFQVVPPPLPGSQHLRAIILVTDGAPCIPPAPGQYINCFDLIATGASSHIQQVGQHVNAFFNAHSDMFIIALDADSQFWPAVETDWQYAICGVSPCDTTKQAFDVAMLSANMQDVIGLLWRTLNPNFNSQQIPHQNGQATFVVPPYTQSILVAISKTEQSPLNGVTFTNPIGVIENNNPDGVDSLIQTHSIGGKGSIPPLPGTWTMLVPPVGNDTDIIRDMQINLSQFAVGANLAIDGNPPKQWIPSILTANIIDGSGRPIGRYIDSNGSELYPLTVTLEVVDKNQNTQTLSLASITNQENTHEYQVEWIPTNTTEHSFYLTASYLDDNGQTLYLLQREQMELDSNGDTQPDLSALSPSGTTIQWTGLSTGTVPQGTNTSLGLQLIDNATNMPIPADTSAFMLQVQVVDTITNQPVNAPMLLTNTSAEQGVVSGDVLIDLPGQYLLTGTLGKLDSNGNFVPLPDVAASSPAYNLEVRPVYEVEMRLTSPTQTRTPGLGPFPIFWTNAPVRIAIEVFDDQGNPVDLALITGGNVQTPTLTVVRESDKKARDLTTSLVDSQVGVYVVESDSLGLGTYTFNASLPDDNSLFVADYKWSNRLSATLTQERYIPLFAWVEWIGTPIVLLVLALSFWWLASREINARENPLKGKIQVVRHNEGVAEVIWEKDLTRLGKNFAHFGGFADRGDLRKRTNQVVRQLNVTTLNEPQYSENGQVVLENLQVQGLTVDGKPDGTINLIAGSILAPGSRLTLWFGSVNGIPTEFTLEKNNGEGASGTAYDFNDALSGFSA